MWLTWNLGEEFYFYYFNVTVTQINYFNLNKQNSIEEIRGRSHEKGLIQVFMLDDMKLKGFWGYLDYNMVNRIKQSSWIK